MADLEFPGLGFDPLPGNPQVARDLERDARIFGQRMTDQASALRRLASRDGWVGEAAEVFAKHLKTLPPDLDHCGEAFTDLADALATYAGAFEFAKRTTVADLERRAVEARQKIQASDVAYHTPVISAPGDCTPLPDRNPLDAAQDELGAILREGHGFADKFNDSAEVQHLEHVIRHHLTHYAPDEPGWNILKHWAGDVFKATPIGAAINATHELINHYAEFFNHLAGFLSELSGVVGLVALPAMFFPPLGTALGVAILGLTATSAGIKTSLYVGHARDVNGKLLVSGGNLFHSYVDVTLSAGAVGAVAGVERAGTLAAGGKTTFGKELAKQFEKDTFSEALRAPKVVIGETVADLERKAAAEANKAIERVGPKAVANAIFKKGIEGFGKDQAGRALNWGGLVVGGAGPAANTVDASNVFGWRSLQHIPNETLDLFHKEPGTPDLQVRTQPVMSSRTPHSTMGPHKPPPSPVMDT